MWGNMTCGDMVHESCLPQKKGTGFKNRKNETWNCSMSLNLAVGKNTDVCVWVCVGGVSNLYFFKSDKLHKYTLCKHASLTGL